MVTRRDWLVEKGLAKPGRGRMSKEAHEAINEAIANGMKFSDVKDSGDKPVKSEEVTKNALSGDFFGETPAQIYFGNWKMTDRGKTVTLSEKEVCSTCGISLGWHRCSNPTHPNSVGEIVEVTR